MPMTFDVENDILVIRAEEKWNLSEMKQTLHAAIKSLGGRRLNGILLDDRNARFTGIHESFSDMARLHNRLSGRIGHKMAVLVSDDLHFGLARMSAAIHSLHGIVVEPFRDKEKAWAWLVGRR
ncbi:MAG: hypothetical protein K9L59_12950 [Desulfobacterales bacterium]|nr:hypothetical protein [Desulfobacterales bacterium]MCF8078635.1 hypothetical protein [Desulfobacterales bacterium]